MTETKFTPGPWIVDGSVIRGDSDHIGRTVAVASTLNVAWPYGRRATKEEPYNAHLIAAAPELYEALEDCITALEPYDDIKPRDWKTDRENMRRVYQSARAALAKARGES